MVANVQRNGLLLLLIVTLTAAGEPQRGGQQLLD